MNRSPLPRVIVYSAVSLDGQTGGFAPDVGQFYSLIGVWKEDATLVGSETILKAPAQDFEADGVGEETTGEASGEAAEPGNAAGKRRGKDRRPLLVVPDSRGRIRNWRALRNTPYWRDVLVLCSRRTPQRYLRMLERQNIHHIVAGSNNVDLRAALRQLRRRCGVNTVRVDSGGTLCGALLRAGLVDEVSLLVHPCLVGDVPPRSFFRMLGDATDRKPLPLRFHSLRRLANGLLWLRYRTVRRSTTTKRRTVKK
jgi:2,5-diamino-6-(ribosylamino)-4(3H)-pyrimidinone 5'-phosphate reductase